jgi:hypothetical protein
MSWWSSIGSLWGKGGGTSAATSGIGGLQTFDMPSTGNYSLANAKWLDSSPNFQMGSGKSGWMSALGEALDKGGGQGKSKDPTGDAILAPERAERARKLGIMSMYPGIGSGIQPVGTTAGARQMVGAMAGERERLANTELAKGYSDVSKELRKTAALGNTVEQGVGLVKDLLVKYFTGGA